MRRLREDADARVADGTGLGDFVDGDDNDA